MVRPAKKGVIRAVPIHHDLIARRARDQPGCRAQRRARALRAQVRDLHRLQHAPRQFRERQFPIERDALHRDVRARRHRVTQAVGERGKSPSVPHRDRALHRPHREPLPRSRHRRDHRQITAPGNWLLKLRDNILRQLPPHRRRHREFQRALWILINEIRHLIAPLLRQRPPIVQKRRLFLRSTRARKAIRPIAKARKHRFLHRQLPPQILPHRQHHLRRHFTSRTHRARSRRDRFHLCRLLRCGRRNTWRDFFQSRRWLSLRRHRDRWLRSASRHHMPDENCGTEDQDCADAALEVGTIHEWRGNVRSVVLGGGHFDSAVSRHSNTRSPKRQTGRSRSTNGPLSPSHRDARKGCGSSRQHASVSGISQRRSGFL